MISSTRAFTALCLLLASASLCAGQGTWRWALRSGSTESVAYDAGLTLQHGPLPNSDANAWTTDKGDFYILQNHAASRTTEFWRWSAASAKWTLLASKHQPEAAFSPPPQPDNVHAEPHAELHHDDEYERAEREAAQRALEKAEAEKAAAATAAAAEKASTAGGEGGEEGSDQGNDSDDGKPEEGSGDTDEDMPAAAARQDTSGAGPGPVHTPEPAKAETAASGELPEARLGAATAVDSVGGRLFMFGGTGGLSMRRGDQLWMYDVGGASWTLLSGADIDYTGALCDPAAAAAPCMVTTSHGFGALAYLDGSVYAFIQAKTAGSADDGAPDRYAHQAWRFALDTRAWARADAGPGPGVTSFPARTAAFAHGGALYVARAGLVVGAGGAAAGEVWRLDAGSGAWTVAARPALAYERAASWAVQGLLVTYMPGGALAGVNGAREVPAIPGAFAEGGAWSPAERLVVLDLQTGRYGAVEKKELQGMHAGKHGEFSQAFAPGRRFDGVRTGGVGFGTPEETHLYMFGGSTMFKRNPDRRNDLWEAVVDVNELRAKAGL